MSNFLSIDAIIQFCVLHVDQCFQFNTLTFLCIGQMSWIGFLVYPEYIVNTLGVKWKPTLSINTGDRSDPGFSEKRTLNNEYWRVNWRKPVFHSDNQLHMVFLIKRKMSFTWMATSRDSSVERKAFWKRGWFQGLLVNKDYIHVHVFC